ncbi:MAG: T9SS type A sorting domain-containing protein [Bacteroidia bacterium]
MGACSPEITVNGGGELVLGDDNRPYPNNNKAKLYIPSNGRLRINNGGTLTIHEGSRLIIEEGAQLVLSGNTNIVLAGDDAVMKVYGQIILENGADFTFTKGSASRAGYLFFFKTATNSSEFISPTGAGSIIDLSGVSYSSDNIAIVQDGAWKVPSGIDTIKLFSGMIRYANNGSMEVHCPIKAQTVTFDEVYTNAVGTTGLKTYGQPGVELNACIFKNLVTGMDVSNGSSTTMPEIDNCHFLYCNTGISYVGGSFEPYRFRAQGCDVGGFVFVDQHSTIETIILTDNTDYGLYLGNVGTSQVEVFFDGGTVNDNGTGIYQDATNLGITAACLSARDNETGIYTAGNLNLSTTTSVNGQTGGNCTFEDNTTGISVFGELYLDEGYNNFISSAPAPYNFIAGHIPFAYLPASGNLPATNNYWDPAPSSLSSAGSNWYNLTSFNGVNPHPYNVLLTGSMLTSATSNCGGGSGTGGTSGGGGGYVPGMRNASVSNPSDILSMQLFPNPHAGEGPLMISLHTHEAGNCRIQIVDQLGKVQLVINQHLDKGDNMLKLNPSGLAAGMYVLRCSQNGTVLSKAFVKH